jgi:hypothetical protein
MCEKVSLKGSSDTLKAKKHGKIVKGLNNMIGWF